MTYDYLCETCFKEWEEEQKITDTELEICPFCNSAQPKRLINSQNSFQLKGNGWARDGYNKSKGEK